MLLTKAIDEKKLQSYSLAERTIENILMYLRFYIIECKDYNLQSQYPATLFWIDKKYLYKCTMGQLVTIS